MLKFISIELGNEYSEQEKGCYAFRVDTDEISSVHINGIKVTVSIEPSNVDFVDSINIICMSNEKAEKIYNNFVCSTFSGDTLPIVYRIDSDFRSISVTRNGAEIIKHTELYRNNLS